ncbi:glycoside hydrolase domain-containing protein [Bacteroides fragilis]
MKKLFLWALSALLTLPAAAQDFVPEASFYGENYWTPDTLGNHRAIVSVNTPASVAEAYIPWRRRDANPEQKGIIVINVSTGKAVDNVLPVEINREYGRIRFDASGNAGDYYVYYLPYHTSGGPYPKVNYPQQPDKADPQWKATCKATPGKAVQAKLVRFESLGSFNSFYPMEIIATAQEKQALIDANSNKPFLLLPEDRKYPIRMFDDLSYRQVTQGATGEFFGEADLNEYYVLQLGLWAFKNPVNGVKVTFTDLKGRNESIPASALTCFNTEGTDWLGRPIHPEVNVGKGRVQPLWIGIQMPEHAGRGIYRGTVTVSDLSGASQEVNIAINLSDNVLVDKGDGDLWRLSRLRWLNSQYAVNNRPVKPFIPIKVADRTISVLGRSVTAGELGLPASIRSYFTEEMTSIGKEPKDILSQPMEFVIRQNGKPLPVTITSPLKFGKKEDGTVSWTATGKAGALEITVLASMEFDGFMNYQIKVKAAENTSVDDIALLTSMPATTAKYRLGMGYEGSLRPKSDQWKWNVERNQEGFWFGDVNAGMQCLFRAENYRRPLNTNFYKMQPLNMPPSWFNDGKGGISYKEKGNQVDIKTYSGSRTLQKGEELNFDFLVLVTPFKPIDTMKQWTDRYYHGYQPAEKLKEGDAHAYQAVDVVGETGANVINLHHGNAVNPHINYPFFRPAFMKQYVDESHAKGYKVKIYYTVRELTNHAPELFALKSLGHEIFSPGKGGGYAWLQEHLDGDYIGAWFVDAYKDAAIVNTGISRWHNFYVEGLNWLTKNVGIDGVYIDDLAFDRNTMKRIRRVLESNRPDPRIDVHSANQFNPADGYINSIFLYMEHMPYLDRLWFGEYFKYEKSPEYWLTDVSGIPFGMMSEMLQDGGNPYRGMLYGMTAREPMESIPSQLWKVWDAFGIKDSRMMGYWVSYNPVKTGRNDILATSFVKDGKVMIAIASWAKKDSDIKLQIDWEKLGIDADKARLTAPDIKGFQEGFSLSPKDKIKLPKDKGFIFILE